MRPAWASRRAAIWSLQQRPSTNRSGSALTTSSAVPPATARRMARSRWRQGARSSDRSRLAFGLTVRTGGSDAAGSRNQCRLQALHLDVLHRAVGARAARSGPRPRRARRTPGTPPGRARCGWSSVMSSTSCDERGPSGAAGRGRRSGSECVKRRAARTRCIRADVSDRASPGALRIRSISRVSRPEGHHDGRRARRVHGPARPGGPRGAGPARPAAALAGRGVAVPGGRALLDGGDRRLGPGEGLLADRAGRGDRARGPRPGCAARRAVGGRRRRRAARRSPRWSRWSRWWCRSRRSSTTCARTATAGDRAAAAGHRAAARLRPQARRVRRLRHRRPGWPGGWWSWPSGSASPTSRACGSRWRCPRTSWPAGSGPRGRRWPRRCGCCATAASSPPGGAR